MAADMSVSSDENATVDMSAAAPPTAEASIVPADSISGRALVAVVAIMTFLAALTLGGVVLVRGAAGEWQSAVAREVTIQVRPGEGRDIEADVRLAGEIASATPGIAGVRPYSKEESARLLEPWLGSGLSFDDLPVPRLIVVRIDGDATPDFAALRKALAERVPGATLDDHRGWIDRMGVMAGSVVATGIAVLILVLAATVLSVTFATRGAMATNRPIIEVLHFVGAKDAFIAGQFQRHFLLLGLKGGAIGGVAAMVLFAVAGLLGNWLLAAPSQDQVASLFGSASVGIGGYVAVAAMVGVIAVVTAATSRLTVYRTLRSIA